MTELIKAIKSENIAIFILWLFHISAIIGIALGHDSWFLTKTPLNLLILFGLLLWMYPVSNLKYGFLFLLCFATGMIVEWLGVNYGFLFGDYSYGRNLGPKIGGVPWLIGINWGILTFTSLAVSNWLTGKLYIRVLTGALIMVGLDFLMEYSAPVIDFWEFELSPVPLSNYIGWFVVSAMLHLVLQLFKLEGNLKFSLHLLFSQLIFFGFLYVRYTL